MPGKINSSFVKRFGEDGQPRLRFPPSCWSSVLSIRVIRVIPGKMALPSLVPTFDSTNSVIVCETPVRVCRSKGREDALIEPTTEL